MASQSGYGTGAEDLAAGGVKGNKISRSLKNYDPAAFDWTPNNAVSMIESSSFEPNEVAGPLKAKKKVKV